MTDIYLTISLSIGRNM